MGISLNCNSLLSSLFSFSLPHSFKVLSESLNTSKFHFYYVPVQWCAWWVMHKKDKERSWAACQDERVSFISLYGHFDNKKKKRRAVYHSQCSIKYCDIKLNRKQNHAQVSALVLLSCVKEEKHYTQEKFNIHIYVLQLMIRNVSALADLVEQQVQGAIAHILRD